MSFARAIQHRIEARRLPLELYAEFKSAKYVLNVYTTFRLICTMINNHGDWAAAISQHVPRRFIEGTSRARFREHVRSKGKSEAACADVTEVENAKGKDEQDA